MMRFPGFTTSAVGDAMIEKDEWPIEYGDQLIVGSSESDVGICCLWSDREAVARQLAPHDYAVIGNLYSRAGLNPMLRNLLSNPRVRYLVITGRSLTDSSAALLDFFEHGIDSNWKTLHGGAQIDQNLPKSVLDEVREAVRIVDLRSANDFALEFRRFSSNRTFLPPFAQRRVFQKSIAQISTFPSEFSGFVVRGRSIFDAWCELLWTIMTFGHVSGTDYGLEQRELLSVLSIIEKPDTKLNEIPDWVPCNRSEIEAYLRRFFELGDEAGIAYTYGERLKAHWAVDQTSSMIKELKRSRQSRRAVATLWDPIRDAASQDPPCITTIQVFVRDNQLFVSAYIRSNDIYRAYLLNVAALAELQGRIAAELGQVELGTLSVLSSSAHVYSDCWDAAKPALEIAARIRRRFNQDQRGSFVFYTDGDQLAADHYSPTGDLLQTLKAASYSELCALVRPFLGLTDHGIYVGKEIYRLDVAHKTGDVFKQDKIT